jgi:hypothetical protein
MQHTHNVNLFGQGESKKRVNLFGNSRLIQGRTLHTPPIICRLAAIDKMALVATAPAEIEELANVSLCFHELLCLHCNLTESPPSNILNSPLMHVAEGLVPFRSVPAACNVPKTRETDPSRLVCSRVGTARACCVLGNSSIDIF